MSRWISAASIQVKDWANEPYHVRVSDHVWFRGQSLPWAAQVAKEGPYGVTIYRTIPCASLEEARAVAAATTCQWTVADVQ